MVIRVEDEIEPRLSAGRGVSYESPPQPRAQAMALVRLLLGAVDDLAGEELRWTGAIAGGRRTVTITEEPSQ